MVSGCIIASELTFKEVDTMYDETYAPVHCNWCGWSGDEADLDMNEHDEPTYCPVCGHSVCIADG